jgi:hypothetical protein
VRGWDALREGLATRELRLYALAGAAASLALWAFTVVLAIVAYEAGGTGAVMLAVVARVLPGALAGPFVAQLVQRGSPRELLLGLGGAMTAALAALTLVSALGAPFALVLVLAATCSILASGQEPAQAALLPGVAGNPRELAIAHRLRPVVRGAAQCVGALAGGAGAVGASPAAGFAVALVAAAAAPLTVALIAADPHRTRRAARIAGGSVATELQLGLRAVHAASELREAVGLLAAIGLVRGLLDVLVVIVAVKLVGLGTGGVGVLVCAWSVGALAGGLGSPTLLAHGRFAAASDACAALLAAPLAIVAAAADPVVAVLGFAALGLGHAVAQSAGRTLVRRLAAGESRTRAVAVAELGSRLALVAGAILAPLLIAVLGIRGALLAAALVLPAVVIARWRAVQRLDARAAAAAAREGWSVTF